MKIKGKRFSTRCFKCGSEWEGFGQPRPRQVCRSCGVNLHSCMNCHHFDREISYSCSLPHTTFVGDREAANYCDSFEMVNDQLKAIEARTQRARAVWNELFRR